MVKFKLDTEICFGSNALDRLDELEGQHVAIITDSFLASTKVMETVKQKLAVCASVSLFDEVTPDPTIDLVTKGLRFLIDAKVTTVIAIGGGSSIDAAKAIVLMARQADSASKIELIAIPTTSGTGSEVTQFAVISDAEKGVKYPLVDASLRPDVAILESEFVRTVPQKVTADTGFDVITHALEAYVSENANDLSDALAEKAVELAYEYLPKAYANGEDLVAREKMHSASCLAGIAFSSAGLGINHSIAHGLGAKFHIPHGRANAMLLPHIVKFNACLEESFGLEYSKAALKYAHIAKILGISHSETRKDVLAFIKELEYMLKMTKTPTTLKEVGIKREDFLHFKASIVEGALADVCTTTNPRKAHSEDIERILEDIME
ncbi:alcohol dehydrogenase [Sporanaerobium hydrogeniformans]|uniref:Alcohol dehydrogenase n=1 Tax=Sporanaerobium hydrogeniformans TaxID=3072179 RepID=A0AC61DAJ3_9FIRM|nr:1-propanol dehydrogenase PduQ [Sporanaerobium hydrogeniformans]PHV70274.1 alcohol dehydrogenase [Sporanaerobium hydrogeniformans]